jgi:glutathione S-transferase
MTKSEPGPVRIIGSYISPYVRKVLVVLDLKGVRYEIDPIVPYMGDDRFTKLSPLRRIPVLIDGNVVLPDSTVICEYLDETHPSPPLLPADPVRRARARWLEEYADTRMGEVFIWRLFNERVIAPAVWGRKPDEAVLKRALEVELPAVLDQLEAELPEAGFLFGELSRADIAIASFFRNAAFARWTPDAARWPRTAGFAQRVLGLESFVRLRRYEEASLRNPMPKHREVLAALGAPIMQDSYGTTTPRPGVLTT